MHRYPYEIFTTIIIIIRKAHLYLNIHIYNNTKKTTKGFITKKESYKHLEKK